MTTWLYGPQFCVAGGRAVNLADGDAQVPAREFHRPVWQVAELLVEEVESGQQLPAVSGELLSKCRPKRVSIGSQYVLLLGPGEGDFSGDGVDGF